MLAKVNAFTNEEFTQIVASCTSMADVARKLGYTSYSGDISARIRKRIEALGLSIDHFSLGGKHPIKRDPSNVFIKNSTADQSTLRKFYFAGKYTPYVCSICGQEPQWQNKPLTLILDHINGHNHDDRLENLRWVCPNCNQQLDTTGYKKMRVKNENKKERKNFCSNCGKEISLNATLCMKCLGEFNRVCKRPDRQELKDMIRVMSFVDIGKKYGVSDNAIRKWCDSYNLPRLSSVIKQISDEDWAVI